MEGPYWIWMMDGAEKTLLWSLGIDGIHCPSDFSALDLWYFVFNFANYEHFSLSAFSFLLSLIYASVVFISVI